MQLGKVEYTIAHATAGRPSVLATAGTAHAFRLHARCLGVLFAVTACLALSAPVRAQHPAPHGLSAQGVATTRAADDASIRPFHITVPDEALVDLRRRIDGDTLARAGDGHGCIARRAARDDAGTRALLGDRLRLAQGARRD